MKKTKKVKKTNRVALVTGATGIIGPVICKILQQNGWLVAACASSEKSFTYYEKISSERLEASGTFVARLDNREICHNLVKEVESKLGPISLLVNNAASNPKKVALKDLDEDYVKQMMAINFLSPLWLSQAAGPSLVAQQGSIINISSVRVEMLLPENILYPVLKAALEKLTHILALELGPKGVRTNAIRVGAVPGTAFMHSTLETLSQKMARKLIAEIMPRHLEASKGQSTIGRAGKPEDIGNAVAFLASEKAGFFNGAILTLDGGYSLQRDESHKSACWNPEQAVHEWMAKQGLSSGKYC